MTQLEQARKSKITPEMEQVAKTEGIMKIHKLMKSAKWPRCYSQKSGAEKANPGHRERLIHQGKRQCRFLIRTGGGCSTWEVEKTQNRSKVWFRYFDGSFNRTPI